MHRYSEYAYIPHVNAFAEVDAMFCSKTLYQQTAQLLSEVVISLQ